ncbi:tumor necrosis factor receptor superfamily member 4 isoform X2 [Pelodiscus sinensis]|uniref:tumor necrosis factor receptor superfamily member 4 isoform X2 n=1 Tax=Pelodiscus sinensis TaxID=13735 RepID=UPI003F6D0372
MVEQGLAKCICTFTAVLLFLLFSAMCCSGLSCGQNEYPLHGKCCKECAPERGRIEVKKCDKRSDAVCTCMRGYTLADTSSEESASGKNCVPCSHGHFSNGNNEKCQPWKNCTANGKKTLRAGTQTEDAICDDQGEQATTLRTSTLYLFVIDPRRNSSTAALTTFTPQNNLSNPEVINDNQAGTNWGFLSLILICLTLLLVSGMSILLLTIQTAKKETTKRPPVNRQHDGKSFRIPIQEEQIDSNSSLIKN